MADHDVWMALYIGAYLADTMHLARQHHGSYLLLIMAAYKNAGWLPNDDASLAAVAKCSPKEWKAERGIFAAFFEITAERWTHKRVTAEWERAAKLTDNKRNAGRKAAAKRWHSSGIADASQNDAPSQSPSPSPSVTTTLSVTNSAPVGARQAAKSQLLTEEWAPSLADIAAIRQQVPWLVGELYDKRMADFRDWCTANATRTFNPLATWRGFMRRTPEPRVTGNGSRFVTGNATKPMASEPTLEDWKGRIKWHREKGMWNPMWGGAPDGPAYIGPKEALQ